MAAPRPDCSVSCVPVRASERMHSAARDALSHLLGNPRGSPGEGGAPEGALTHLGATAPRAHATG